MSAFEGVRVLDCTQGLAGPLASMLLADFGAEVLKVEPPEGDRARDDPGYLVWNRNKRRLALDLGSPADRQRLEPLLAAADIAFFDHAPSRLTALGLAAGEVMSRHPRLVHVWTPPYGVTGRWSELPAHHASLTGMTGSAFRQGAYADQPVWHVAQIAHHTQGVMAASAAGAALIQRDALGRGRSLVVSGFHAMAETSSPMAIIGTPPMPRGRPLGGAPNYRLYQCGDGEWLFLATLFARFFQSAMEVLGLEHLPAGMDVAPAIQAVLLTRPRAHWLELFREHDVPAGPVGRREDFLKSEIITANGLRAELAHPGLGAVEMVGAPATLHETPAAVRALMTDATQADIDSFVRPRPSAEPLEQPAGPPLSGVKVLDLGSVIAGAYAATILANLGADVVKVESREGDPFRYAPSFINFNRGKRGLGIDLKSPEGRETFIDMARSADVVIDNYRLGVRRRLGIDYDVLAQVNPRLVSLSINTYGSKGSEAHLPGFDPLLQARSGLMAAQGGDGEPVFHAIPVNDVATAAMGAFAVIAALHARQRTGCGQNVETSLAAQAALYQSGDLVDYEGRPPRRQGARDCIGFAALDRFYQARGGWLTLACTRPAHFAALARALGHPDWIDRWGGAAALSEPRNGELADAIEAAFAQIGRDEVLETLFEAGVPVAPVLRGEEALRCDFLWDNHCYELRAHPIEGELIASQGFAAFDGETLRFERLEPGIGEDSVEVLTDYGAAPERIAELARAGVIFGS